MAAMRSTANGNIVRGSHVRVRAWRNAFVAWTAVVVQLNASNASKHRPNDMTRSATAAFAADLGKVEWG
jgi:hypothetical protein